MTRHPYIWTIALFIISTLVSLYSPEIRLALSSAVRKGGTTHRRRMLMRLENRLGLINWINGNAYNFLLWLFGELRFPVFFSLTLFNAFAVRARYPLFAIINIVLVYGSWFGSCIRIFNIVEVLSHYAQSKADLEKIIAELKAGAPGRRNHGSTGNVASSS